jgi:hypothetical protein
MLPAVLRLSAPLNRMVSVERPGQGIHHFLDDAEVEEHAGERTEEDDGGQDLEARR